MARSPFLACSSAPVWTSPQSRWGQAGRPRDPLCSPCPTVLTPSPEQPWPRLWHDAWACSRMSRGHERAGARCPMETASFPQLHGFDALSRSVCRLHVPVAAEPAPRCGDPEPGRRASGAGHEGRFLCWHYARGARGICPRVFVSTQTFILRDQLPAWSCWFAW